MAHNCFSPVHWLWHIFGLLEKQCEASLRNSSRGPYYRRPLWHFVPMFTLTQMEVELYSLKVDPDGEDVGEDTQLLTMYGLPRDLE